jgi:hypothetical protein
MTTIEGLPFEILSAILKLAAEENFRDPDCVTYTYGLTQAARPLQPNASVQKYVLGQLPPDVRRWNAVSPFRFSEFALA